jgi:hypothetical protein
MKSLLLSLLLVTSVSAQTAGQYLFQRIGSNQFVSQYVTPQNGQYLRWVGGQIGSGSPAGSGTVTDFIFTDSTGIDGTVTNSTSTPTLSLSLTNAAVGLSNVENIALSTWTGSTAITTLGTVTGTWQGTAISVARGGTGITASGSAGNVLTSTGTGWVSAPALGSNLTDPNADRIVFWDDSAGQVAWLTAGSGLTISGTTISASGGGVTDGNKGDITVSSGGTVWTISNGAVTLAKQANMATSSLVYRKTAGTGAPEINTLATLKTDLGLSGTNTGDQTITLTGDVTGSGTGSFAATIASGAVTYAKMQNVTAASRLLGRQSGTSGSVQEIILGTGLTMSGTTLNASVGIGGTVGPTINAIPRADGSGGSTLKASGVTIDDSNLVSTSGTASGFISSITPTGPSERVSSKVSFAGLEFKWLDNTSATITGDIVSPSSFPGAANLTWELPNVSGTIALTSQITGTKTIGVFTARDNQPPASNFATLDTRNSIALLDFDTATEEAAIFVRVIPEGAILTSGITVRITWTAATATSGDCRWGAQWMRCNTDIDSDNFDTATEVTTTTNAVSGIPNVTSITCTAIDGVTVGDMYRLRIYRDTGDAADTMAGDAELLTVEVRTAN